jgi:hypothetical protein
LVVKHSCSKQTMMTLWSPKINIELGASLSENISSHNVDASFYAIHWGFMSQIFNIISWDYVNEHLQSQYEKNKIHWEESCKLIIYHNLT